MTESNLILYNEIYNLFCNNPLINPKKYVLLDIFIFYTLSIFFILQNNSICCYKEIENG